MKFEHFLIQNYQFLKYLKLVYYFGFYGLYFNVKFKTTLYVKRF